MYIDVSGQSSLINFNAGALFCGRQGKTKIFLLAGMHNYFLASAHNDHPNAAVVAAALFPFARYYYFSVMW